MLLGLSQRLLPALQLTRMALVFTAISNSLCTLLLRLRRDVPSDVDTPLIFLLDFHQVILVALISIGLYGFGMSLNDIIDRRRDQQLAAHRPLPSGRINVQTAYFICVSLGLLSVGAAALYAKHRGSPADWLSLALAIWTGLLITFYDLAGKYLVATGLLTLGIVRFFHALIPSPQIPVLWHPLLLFTHVTVLSALAYAWEEKRPALTASHWWAVGGGVAAFNLLAVGGILFRSHAAPHMGSLWPTPWLLLPLAAILIFIALAWHIRRHAATPREAGQSLMLTGLLWLIVYDSAFVAAYLGLLYGLAMLMLLPISYVAVQIMRWWSKLVLFSQQPAYKRVRGGREGQSRV